MRFLLVLIPVLMLAACDKPQEKAKPVPEVFVLPARQQPYHPNASFNARIQSRSDVEIKAQVTGKLIAAHFVEGDRVQAGARLFDIDPAPFEAAVRKAQADLTKAKTAKTHAQRNFERGKTLVKDGYISAAELDNLESAQQEAVAAEEAAAAALESAQVDLEYTRITAPQAGRLGRSIPALGSIVGPQSGALTTLVGQNDMDAVFQIPETLMIRARLDEANRERRDNIEVSLTLPGGAAYAETGKIDYFSNRVDPATGTMEVRARIANPDDLLRPGMFVRVNVRLKSAISMLMVPQAAVQVDQRGTYVFTVSADNLVARKNITTSERVREDVVVTQGLEEGDSVIIRGLQKVRPGDQVQALPYEPATKAVTGDAS